MRFIDQDEIEVDLPVGWAATVQAAWSYVEGKEAEAAQVVVDKVGEQGCAEDELQQQIDNAKTKARKAAITYKSLWSDLSQILADQSKGKCWYCETNEVRSDNPIDHFRPKGNVSECNDHPGYWWLAFDWKNFRYSCTYCNSRRVAVETAGGKQDYFPIFIPPDWNRCAADSNIERPMLLDPVEDSDCKLLTFNENGEACSVEKNVESDEYKKVEKSIELYHLNHKPTVRERRIIFQQIRSLISNTNQLLEEGVDENSDAIKSNRKSLFRLIRRECKSTKFNTAARLYLMRFAGDYDWVKDILDRA